jgi:hypothetical protein
MTEPTATIQFIENWLASKQTVLLGSSWDVTNPQRRRLAAEWFRGQMIEFVEAVDAAAEAKAQSTA